MVVDQMAADQTMVAMVVVQMVEVTVHPLPLPRQRWVFGPVRRTAVAMHMRIRRVTAAEHVARIPIKRSDVR